MSKLLEKEILENVDKIERPEPVYETAPYKMDGDDLVFEMQSSIEDSDHSLHGVMVKYSDTQYDFDTGKYVTIISDQTTHNTISKHIHEMILDWIEHNVPSYNPKLTPQYRWFAKQELSDAMYIAWKYMCSHAAGGFYNSLRYHHRNEIHNNNILCLLEYIRIRGE